MAKKRKNKRMRKRRWFTATERVEVWDRWQRGESSQSIGRALDRGGSAIHRQLAVYGGIRPQSRCRSSRALTLVEREEISRGIAAKEVGPFDCRATGSVAIDGEPGGQPKRGL